MPVVPVVRHPVKVGTFFEKFARSGGGVVKVQPVRTTLEDDVVDDEVEFEVVVVVVEEVEFEVEVVVEEVTLVEVWLVEVVVCVDVVVDF
jgi:hypothetical protein